MNQSHISNALAVKRRVLKLEYLKVYNRDDSSSISDKRLHIFGMHYRSCTSLFSNFQ